MIHIDELETIQHSPEMIETAYNYHTMCSASKRSSLLAEHSVISGLALEIIFKSFKSRKVQGDKLYQDSYESIRGHDLVSLMSKIPEAYKDYLFNESDMEVIEEYRDIFTKTRYQYEPKVKIKITNCFIKLVGRTIYKMMDIYRHQGCYDPFITAANFDELCDELYRYNSMDLRVLNVTR
ncbi:MULTISPECIES: hypothetical protein [unclassified Vibrio]|uniref:hypothetical protein n=1 Tax=unclassified Vibrio TaxID=2614977 RepID=UPI001A8CBFDE|nr:MULTISPECIES: hypothetical protein [unclassified Vibrio]MBO0135332.1 hypothetical protein [Vibrio sp. Vb2736]MDW1855486.1 hypothetical protein [Vibrio sp. Vb0974]MDW2049430.1 hypothetical protein [Vibrio sp. 977]